MNKTSKTTNNLVVEFTTIDGVNIKMVKEGSKYRILINEPVKRIKDRKVYESLHKDSTIDQFFKICNFFTNKINE